MIKLQKNLFEGNHPLTQRFGENPQAYAQFGLKGHNGIDYGLPTGTPLYSCIDGVVTEVLWDKTGYGKYIKIENDECGVLYGHMNALSPLPVGDHVRAGDFIGPSGNTGNSTGPHLHFGVFPKPRDRTNGYAGYIDPLGDDIFWVDDYYASDTAELEKKISALETELDDMRNSRNGWRKKYEDLEDKYVEETLELKQNIDRLQKDKIDMQYEIDKSAKMVAALVEQSEIYKEEKNRLEGIVATQEAKLNKCMEGNSLYNYSWRERFLSLFRGVSSDA